MPWNQPGSGNGDDKDPWSQQGGQRRGRRDGPPDLDEILRDAKNRFNSLFGGGRRGGGGGSSDDKGKQINAPGGGMLVIALVVALGFWLFSGIYTVDEGEQAVVLRFGKYLETRDAGLNWRIPTPIDSVDIINVQNVNTVEVGYRKSGRNVSTVPREALMLTQDENIIDVQFAVQYDIKNPTDLLFQVSEYNSRDIAESVVRQATESAVREIVGRSTLDFAITEGRAELAAETKSLVQQILDRYQTGINIRTVEMQNAQPPAQVKNAFDDVVKAREDEVRLKNLAEAYANDIIPRARGASARIMQEAEAYQASIIAKAEGEASRFGQVLDEYTKAPGVTRDRLYIESMEAVLSNSSKIIIDQQGSNSVMYLPLDQLIRNRNVSQSDSQLPDFNTATQSLADQSVGGGLRSINRSVNRTGRN